MIKPSKSLLLSFSIFNLAFLAFLHNLYADPLDLTKLMMENLPQLKSML